jgi:hypothetical protein
MTDNLEARLDTLELIVGSLLDELVECKLALQGAETHMALKQNTERQSFRQFQDSQRALQQGQMQLAAGQTQAQQPQGNFGPGQLQARQAGITFGSDGTVSSTFTGSSTDGKWLSMDQVVTDGLTEAMAPATNKWWRQP